LHNKPLTTYCIAIDIFTHLGNYFCTKISPRRHILGHPVIIIAAQKTNWSRHIQGTLLFLFVLVRTTTKSIQFINKPVFLLSFFHCWYFAFISEAATTKKRQFIYDLSMLCLGFGHILGQKCCLFNLYKRLKDNSYNLKQTTLLCEMLHQKDDATPTFLMTCWFEWTNTYLFVHLYKYKT
jgi:hypothetical protein